MTLAILDLDGTLVDTNYQHEHTRCARDAGDLDLDGTLVDTRACAVFESVAELLGDLDSPPLGRG